MKEDRGLGREPEYFFFWFPDLQTLCFHSKVLYHLFMIPLHAIKKKLR